MGGYLEITQDITHLRNTMEALKAERDFIGAVLDTVDAIVAVFDSNGKIVRWNRACERVTGYSIGEVQGKPFWEVLVAPEERSAVAESFRAKADAAPSQAETNWLSKNGQKRRIAWSSTVVVGTDGTTRHTISTGLDITERKRLEEQIAQSQKMEAMG